jgi:hypothetical protein
MKKLTLYQGVALDYMRNMDPPPLLRGARESYAIKLTLRGTKNQIMNGTRAKSEVWQLNRTG